MVCLCSRVAARAEDASEAPLPAGVVARVNGEPITRDELVDVLLMHYAQRALDAMIQQKVIRQEARRLNITVSPAELDRAVEAFLAGEQFPAGMPLSERRKFWMQVLEQRGMSLEAFRRDLAPELLLEKISRRRVEVTPEMIDREFNARHGEQLVVREIIVADEARARDLWRQLDRGESFAELARHHSLNETEAAAGGRVSLPITRGLRGEAFDRVAFALEPGRTSEPFALGRYWVIVRVEQRRPGDGTKLSDVEGRLREEILEREAERRKGDVLGDLLETATVERGAMTETTEP